MEDQEKSNFEPSSLGTFSLFEPTLANFERYWANFKRYWQILSVIGQILSVFGQNLKKHSSHRVMGNNCIVLQGVSLAQKLEQMILSDDRFEIPAERHLGMLVFRLKGENDMTEKLLKKVNGSGKS